MNSISLRDATAADLPAISEIYNYYVLHSTSTYQLEPETLADRQAWFDLHSPDKYPVVVAELDGRVVGWGSLSRFHVREGYAPTVEASVYIAAGFHRRGRNPHDSLRLRRPTAVERRGIDFLNVTDGEHEEA